MTWTQQCEADQPAAGSCTRLCPPTPTPVLASARIVGGDTASAATQYFRLHCRQTNHLNPPCSRFFPAIITRPADVDGTLIHSIGKEANRLHKECFTAGFKEVFGLDTNIDVVEHHGSTDPLIVLKVLEHHGIPKEQVQMGFELCLVLLHAHYSVLHA